MVVSVFRSISEICLLRLVSFAELRDHHTQARVAIDEAVKETLHYTPLRMIDTKTGHLCEEARIRSLFEDDSVFGDLIVSMTERMDTDRIKCVVEGFFRCHVLPQMARQRTSMQ